jgi:hypothetical protein
MKLQAQLRNGAYLFALVICVALVAGAYSRAQSSAASVSGRWVGVFDTVHADGRVEPDVAYFELKEEGGTITGGAGNNRSKLSPITNGQAQDGAATFDVVVNPTLSVHFKLKLEGDHLRGSATGLPLEPGDTIAIDVARWPADAAQPAVAHAQDQLFATVAGLDKKLFDAYNSCDLATMGSLVADDLEFYHDKTGLTVGKQPFLDAIKSNICGKTQRTLVPGTLEVYPLANFGAVEMGVHRFTHPSNPELGVGEGKFITVWRFKDGAWQMTRAISYDHQPAKTP